MLDRTDGGTHHGFIDGYIRDTAWQMGKAFGQISNGVGTFVCKTHASHKTSVDHFSDR